MEQDPLVQRLTAAPSDAYEETYVEALRKLGHADAAGDGADEEVRVAWSAYTAGSRHPLVLWTLIQYAVRDGSVERVRAYLAELDSACAERDVVGPSDEERVQPVREALRTRHRPRRRKGRVGGKRRVRPPVPDEFDSLDLETETEVAPPAPTKKRPRSGSRSSRRKRGRRRLLERIDWVAEGMPDVPAPDVRVEVVDGAIRAGLLDGDCSPEVSSWALVQLARQAVEIERDQRTGASVVRFARRLVEALGGLAERRDDGGADLLLPRAVAQRWSLPDEFRVDAEVGAPLRQRLLAAAMGDGRLAVVRASLAAPSADHGVSAVERSFGPKNGSMRVLGASPALATMLVISFRCRSESDSAWSELVDVALDPQGTERAPTLPGVVWAASGVLSDAGVAAGAELGARGWEAAVNQARERALEVAAGLRESAHEALLGEAEQLSVRSRHEQQSLVTRAVEDAEDAERRSEWVERINQVAARCQRQIEFARERSAVTITVEPVTAVVLRLPVVTVRVLLLRRKDQREITLHYGALQRDLHPVICEGCRTVAVVTPELCDQRLHMLCPACAPACPACAARA